MTDNATEAPRRLNAATVLAMMHEESLARATRGSEPSASVEITRNAKGEPQFSVKVYATADADDADVERATGRAYDQAVQAFDALAERFPFGG